VKIKVAAGAYVPFTVVGYVVGGYKLGRGGILLDAGALHIQKQGCLASGKSAVIHDLMRVHKHHGPFGQRDFVEVAVDLAPESRSPGCVQGFDGGVFLFQERSESLLSGFTVIKLHGRFVVELPAYDPFIFSVALGQFGYHLKGTFTVEGIGEGGVLPGTVVQFGSVFIGNQNLWMSPDQPDGRCGR